MNENHQPGNENDGEEKEERKPKVESNFFFFALNSLSKSVSRRLFAHRCTRYFAPTRIRESLHH